MMKKIQNFLKDNIILIFIFFVIFLFVLGIIYYFILQPNNVNTIIEKYKTDSYTIPYYVAERYLIWYNMRTFFFCLNYGLTLLSICASLMTIFYASSMIIRENSEYKKNKYIVFLSLLSICFTVADIFTDSGSMANMAQHAWRELDICIMQTINESELSNECKDKIIIDKVVEMEKYIETYEH